MKLAMLVLVSAASMTSVAAAVPTPQNAPDWQPAFGGIPGTDVQIHALEVFDDGSGPALFAVGKFFIAGGVRARHVAKWNGTRWSPLGEYGSGYNTAVNCLEVFDDGSGPALYAGGDFSEIGGVTAFGIARWDGIRWSPVGSGVGGDVDSLLVFDDGGGPALYVGGDFTQAGGQPANHIAKWDGSSWSPLGSGVSGVGGVGVASVLDMAVFDDGSGPGLFAGGGFVSAGGLPARFIAKWNGTEWSELGSGMKGPAGGTVLALQVYDEGNGPALFAGGVFSTAGGVSANFVARWDGVEWSALGAPGGGTNGVVRELGIVDRGAGPELVVAGTFDVSGARLTNQISTWNGTSWSRFEDGIALGSTTFVGAVTVYDDGGGPDLYAAGNFQIAGTVRATNIARWEGSDWAPLGEGPDGAVHALATFDDGRGTALYAGGDFERIGGARAARVARWNGSSWSPLAGGVNGSVRALAEFDGGSGPALVAGGEFVIAGGVAASSIAAWNGSSWSPLGSGEELNGGVRALAVFDDGSGPALFAGGNFTAQGPIASDSIARWNGSSWSGVGGGLSGGPTYFDQVSVLGVFDDGGGPALYAGGSFLMAGGQPVNRIARWDGVGWTSVGGGMDHNVLALAVFDDGAGPALYAGGYFSTAGGVAAARIARWDGTGWSPLGAGLSSAGGVLALAVFDDGSGAWPALHAAGTFDGLPLVPNRVARWDGSAWTQLGSQGSLMNSSVYALAVFDGRRGPALYAGGFFTTSAAGDSYLAKWGWPDHPDVSITSVTRLPQPGAGGIRK